MKKLFPAILALLVTTGALIGCDSTPEESSQASSESSSSVISTVSESTSSQADKVLAPSVDVSEVSSRQVTVSAASVITVDTALREKYFDLLSRHNAKTLPLTDFENPDKMSANELVNYAVGITTPLRHTETAVTSMYLFDFLDLQRTLQKHLGVQIKYTGDITGFIYNSGNNLLSADVILPTYEYYYRLETLSADADGKYTATLNVYRDIFTTVDAYQASLAAVRADITGDVVKTELKNSALITLSFKEMTDGDGLTYLLLLSKSTERK